MTAPPLLVVEGLSVDALRRAPVVEDVVTRRRGGRVARARRRVRQRQDHACARAPRLRAPRPADRAPASVRIAGEEMVGRVERELRALRGRLVSYVPQDPGDGAQPVATHRRPDPRDAAARTRPSGDATRTAARCSSASSCRRPTRSSAASRTSSPAASSSASRSRWRSSATRRWWCSTSRRPGSTSSPRRASSRRSAGCSASSDVAHRLRLARPRRRRRRRRPRSPSCTPGGSSSRARPRRCSARPRHPYTRGLVSSVPDHLDPRRLRGIPGVAVGVGERPAGLRVRAALRAAHRRSASGDARARGSRRRPRRSAACAGGGRPPPASSSRGCSRQPSAPRTPLLRVERCAPRTAPAAHVTVVAADVSLLVAARRMRRARRRVRQRQDDDRALHRRPPPARRRAHPFDGEPLAGTRRHAHARAAPPDPDRLPEPLRVAQPAAHASRDAIARPARVAAGCSRARGAAEVRRLLERVRLPARIGERYPARALRAASASASRSRAPSPPHPDCSSATRSPRRSTSRCRRPCSTCSPSCGATSACAALHHPRPRRRRERRRRGARARARRRPRARRRAADPRSPLRALHSPSDRGRAVTLTAVSAPEADPRCRRPGPHDPARPRHAQLPRAPGVRRDLAGGRADEAAGLGCDCVQLPLHHVRDRTLSRARGALAATPVAGPDAAGLRRRARARPRGRRPHRRRGARRGAGSSAPSRSAAPRCASSPASTAPISPSSPS